MYTVNNKIVCQVNTNDNTRLEAQTTYHMTRINYLKKRIILVLNNSNQSTIWLALPMNRNWSTSTNHFKSSTFQKTGSSCYINFIWNPTQLRSVWCKICYQTKSGKFNQKIFSSDRQSESDLCQIPHNLEYQPDHCLPYQLEFSTLRT